MEVGSALESRIKLVRPGLAVVVGMAWRDIPSIGIQGDLVTGNKGFWLLS